MAQADASLIGRNPAVRRIVPVIAHHEIMSGRNFENLGIVVVSGVALNLDDRVVDTAGQGFLKAGSRFRCPFKPSVCALVIGSRGTISPLM